LVCCPRLLHKCRLCFGRKKAYDESFSSLQGFELLRVSRLCHMQGSLFCDASWCCWPQLALTSVHNSHSLESARSCLKLAVSAVSGIAKHATQQQVQGQHAFSPLTGCCALWAVFVILQSSAVACVRNRPRTVTAFAWGLQVLSHDL
jgi:hypothetical protein